MTAKTEPTRQPRSLAELIHRDVVTIRPDATLTELAGLLLQHGISGVPVVDGEANVIGMVSVTDLLWLSDSVLATPSELRESSRWAGLEDRAVRDIMTPDAFGVGPEASLEDLLEFFSRTGLHRALVLDGRKVVGIVSVTDLLELIASQAPVRRGAGEGL